ncbi:MAG: hypothetical protein JSW27_13190 [Phycisphaerales bacterium]|nr:MAG: hypothetical protein JSW27_13190 [Phycisphaerales bacterium]
MSRIAVDIVLLPDEAVTTLALRANADLVGRCGSAIALHPENCLPHISLAMGCIEPDAVETLRGLLETVGRQHPVGELVLTGVVTSLDARGESVSAFALAKTREVQELHECVVEVLQPHATWDVTEEMLYGDEAVAAVTLAWIRNFRDKAAFAAFFPHITIGYGTVEEVMSFPIRFTAPKLATCHLGNCCTCRHVLTTVPLAKSVSTE